jgi:hypothetical protein
MTTSNQLPNRLPTGEPVPDKPDPQTSLEIAGSSASTFYKYQIIELTDQYTRAFGRIEQLLEENAKLDTDSQDYQNRYKRARDAKADLAIESSLIQGMTAFAGGLLGFIPESNQWWRMLGWLLLIIGVILAIFKGFLIRYLRHFLPSWLYDEPHET